MRTFEASFKITDPNTGAVTYKRLFTRQARSKREVEAFAASIGLKDTQGELIVYPF